MDSQSVWDWALSCRSEPDQPKGKGRRFNLTDLWEEGKITSINSQETGKDNSLFDVYRVREKAENSKSHEYVTYLMRDHEGAGWRGG